MNPKSLWETSARRPYQSAIPWLILAAFTIIWFGFFALTSPQPGGPDVFVFRDPKGKLMILHRTRDGKMELIEAP